MTILRHMGDVTHLLRNVARDEGLRALWRGLGPTLIGVVPARSIYFGTYNRGKQIYSEWLGSEGSSVHMLSAATAGIASACATNPIWLVKTRMVGTFFHILRDENAVHDGCHTT